MKVRLHALKILKVGANVGHFEPPGRKTSFRETGTVKPFLNKILMQYAYSLCDVVYRSSVSKSHQIDCKYLPMI